MGLRAFAAATLFLPFAFGAVPAGATGEVGPEAVAIIDGAVAQPLTAEAGDANRGRAAFANRKLGNCLACHANPDFEGEELFHGEVGPMLDGVGARWSEAELRAIVINSKAVFGDHTIMPAFYRTAGLNRTHADFEGQTILTAQQVEDVIAYLQTLTE
ncbi:MAG: sulfur oxidation c-type cytochrome SoxX [Pseudomonadota bacterium]